MAFIDWTDELSVNVKQIDNEHKKLLSILNTLHLELINKRGQDAQKKSVLQMLDYAKTHFESEEKRMRQIDYPFYEAHIKEHRWYQEKSNKIRARIEKSGAILTLEILNFLRDWWKNHILVTDKKYSTYFNKQGIH